MAEYLKFRKLNFDEIEVKVGNVTKFGYSLLLYKNARVDMAILDETLGCERWQRDHKEVKGNLYCGIGINFPNCYKTDNGINYNDCWVWKWDCGVESAFGDKEKGEASDSFKRAGFNWGIGRELYTSPRIFVECETKYDESKKVYKIVSTDEQKRSQYMRVKEIAYNDKGEISKLVIVDNKNVQVYPKSNISTPKVEENKIANTQSEVCEDCLENVTQVVAQYSNKVYGKCLCRACQKNHTPKSPKEVSL